MFVDSAKIKIKAGNGGNGCVSFHREKYIAKGGPDGGDGGRGGDVIFVVDDGLRTLNDFRYKSKYSAPNGKDGMPGNCSGKSGENLIIKVPPGTIVKDLETGRIIVDLTKKDQERIIAKGGKGGAGNQHFATPQRQLPSFAKPGVFGAEVSVVLELKLIADCGLVGFPNAGKSTILSIVSAARPKIADYPFTTLEPNLGVVSIIPSEAFIIADIPGLIEGASEGIGLGHDFLKHIERTKLIIHVVDLAGVDGRDPLTDFEVINKELREYSKKLADCPQIVIANKMDIPEAVENFISFKAELDKQGIDVYPISAATSHGIVDVMKKIATRLKEIPEAPVVEEIEVFQAPIDTTTYKIIKQGEKFIIEGEWIRRLVNSTNFSNTESLQHFQRVIKNKGVSDELESMGIAEGDTVIADGVEFEYIS